MKTPLNNAVLQSDIDFNGYSAIGASGFGDSNTVTDTEIGLVGDGVTDNTTALQTWINDVSADKVNSTLMVQDGVYIFSGALQDSGLRNAQILLPSTDITDTTYTLTIKGYHPISYNAWPGVSLARPKGAVFKSTLGTGGGSNPSFIGGMGPGNVTAPNLSWMGIRFENMIFQTVQNPLISCLNLSHYSTVELGGDILIMAGAGTGSNDNVQPTTATSYGLLMPLFNQGMLQRGNNVNISNFYTGVLIGELCHFKNLVSEMCIYAAEFRFSYHISLIERFVDWWCTNGLNIVDTHPFQINQHDIERGPDAVWYSRSNDINDPSNKATADITWWTVKTVVGVLNAYTINGGSGVKARRLGAVYP